MIDDEWERHAQREFDIYESKIRDLEAKFAEANKRIAELEAQAANEQQYCSDQVESYEIALTREVKRAEQAEAERDALMEWRAERDPMYHNRLMFDALSQGGEEVPSITRLPKGMWWCPECAKPVPGEEVTYEEYHEVCGAYIGESQPE